MTTKRDERKYRETEDVVMMMRQGDGEAKASDGSGVEC